MKKYFDEWNKQKKALDVQNKKLFFKSGEVWWCSVGVNVASESCGKGETFRRPVLILRKLSATSCIVLPLSTKKKEGSWFLEVSIHGRPSWVLLYQIRMMSTNRFQRRLATLDDNDFTWVKRKLETLLEL